MDAMTPSPPTTSLYGVGLLTRLPDSSARIGATVSVLLEWVDSVAVGD